jgi:hypothetical protein
MIVNRVQGDVFKTPLKHIAFAVNMEGHNNSGFAGAVSSKYWPALENTGGNKLGEVLHHTSDGKTFHALVCHELKANGWVRTPQLVEQCLNSIPGNDEIAVVMMGSGFVGQMSGADVNAILGAMERSKKHVHVYSL